ncbi:MAG TPA: FAD-binding protein [Xanthobacteraceae bacterium]|nr:FAD-binding protein [Xanthobacteraceae bacterium]
MSVTQVREIVSSSADGVRHDTDVLVIGGGPAGAWAAVSAAAQGAKVVLVDKGCCGTSGATASAGTGVWYVQPDPAKRLAAIETREKLGGYLQDRLWMHRVLDRTYESVNLLAAWGYPYPYDDDGGERRTNLWGPDYMRLMRRRVRKSGVAIMDHSPALELLTDEAGAVAGARGIRRQHGDGWIVNAKAVVVATGGCAFQSGGLGCNVLTGDGYLMAAEVGAELTGMEFSNAYAICPAFASVTKTRFYSWATFTYRDGTPIPGAGSHHGRSVIARTLATEPVYCLLDKADEATQDIMRASQPNFFVPFDRAGIDPFRQRFPVTLRLEGTVRGTGGLRLKDETCATSVAGLYAAGDAATRELICGGFTGGGSHNAAWAMSSGFWAGAAAADYARQAGSAHARGNLRSTGGVALAGSGAAEFDPAQITRAVQAEVLPYTINYFRTAEGLTSSLNRLDWLWAALRAAGPSATERVVKARESAAMTATARFMYRSALARTETRGMHKREDHPRQDAAQRHHLVSSGLDDIQIRIEPASARGPQEIAA